MTIITLTLRFRRIYISRYQRQPTLTPIVMGPKDVRPSIFRCAISPMYHPTRDHQEWRRNIA